MRRGPALLALALTTSALAGCVDLAPKSVRPPSAAPSATWPQGAAYAPTQEGRAAELAWRDFVTDPRLRDIVQLALDHNRDLRVAVANIAQARAIYRGQRSDLFPTLGATAGAQFGRATAGGTTAGGSTVGTGVGTGASTGVGASGAGGYDYEVYSVGLGVTSYELDLWSRIRNLTRQAQEQLLTSVEAERTARIGVIAETAAAWLTLAADSERLKLAQSTVQADEQSLQLAQARFTGGITSELDVRQAQIALEQARSDVLAATTLGAQDVNALTLLTGAPIAAALLPTGQDAGLPTLADVPAGLSSAVLLDRPDVAGAEHTLRGYNANIGAARAEYFPRISLTGTTGFSSTELGSLFSGGAWTYGVGPSVTLPIFDWGRRRAGVELARAQAQGALAQYDKVVQTAFREVADALALRGTAAGQIAAQERLVEATRATLTLSQARYTRGIDTYLVTLDAQRSLYAAQQGLIAARLQRANNVVTLYRALGGGVS